MEKINERIKVFYDFDEFMNESRYWTKNYDKKPPYKVVYVGPDFEKISKEIDNEI